MAIWFSFQEWTLIVRKGHGEKGIRITNKLVDIPLSGHLKEAEGSVRVEQVKKGVCVCGGGGGYVHLWLAKIAQEDQNIMQLLLSLLGSHRKQLQLTKRSPLLHLVSA